MSDISTSRLPERERDPVASDWNLVIASTRPSKAKTPRTWHIHEDQYFFVSLPPIA